MGVTGSFGMVRTHAVPAFRSALDELCGILSRATDATFHSHTATTYAELAREVEAGRALLAWLPPVLALQLAERGHVHLLAVPIRSGLATYDTALIVRERVPNRLADLRGSRMAWVDRGSSSGYIVPRIHLASQGVDLRGFFSQEAFFNSHIAVVDAVASGRMDVGATFQSVDAKGCIVSAGWTAPDGSRIRSVKVIATAGPIPNDMIVASKHLPVAVLAGVRRWLLNLDARARELFNEIIHCNEFRMPSPAHLQPLRAMMASALARGLVDA